MNYASRRDSVRFVLTLGWSPSPLKKLQLIYSRARMAIWDDFWGLLGLGPRQTESSRARAPCAAPKVARERKDGRRERVSSLESRPEIETAPELTEASPR